MVEVQSYEVVRRLSDAVELRRYPEHEVVCVDIGGNFETAGYSGFGYLASYISGNNDQGMRIAMTSPVLQQSAGNVETLCFVLPDAVAAAGSPRPTSPGVRVEKRPGGSVAAIIFRGGWKSHTVDKATESLRDVLKREGIAEVGDPFYARYNPPSVPGIFRRNEVLIPVSGV